MSVQFLCCAHHNIWNESNGYVFFPLNIWFTLPHNIWSIQVKLYHSVHFLCSTNTIFKMSLIVMGFFPLNNWLVFFPPNNWLELRLGPA